MDNREAIEILKIERNHMIPTLLPERIEAMDMAISALEVQDAPDTNVGTIRRPDWEEMMVICDNCGHAIHVKRVERREE